MAAAAAAAAPTAVGKARPARAAAPRHCFQFENRGIIFTVVSGLSAQLSGKY
jgi:hypothetical protein